MPLRYNFDISLNNVLDIDLDESFFSVKPPSLGSRFRQNSLKTFVSFDFTLLPSYTYFEMKPNSSTDIIAFFGGVSLTVFLVGYILVSFINRNSFFQHLLVSLFHI